MTLSCGDDAATRSPLSEHGHGQATAFNIEAHDAIGQTAARLSADQLIAVIAAIAAMPWLPCHDLRGQCNGPGGHQVQLSARGRTWSGGVGGITGSHL